MKTQITSPRTKEVQGPIPWSMRAVYKSLPRRDRKILDNYFDSMVWHRLTVDCMAMLLEMEQAYTGLDDPGKHSVRPLIKKMHDEIYLLHEHVMQVSRRSMDDEIQDEGEQSPGSA